MLVPAWLVARELAPGRLGTGHWHAYELLFGYALAVVAGFLIPKTSRWARRWLLGVWLAARTAAVVAPFGAAHAGAAALFAISVAALAAPRLLRAPTTLRNRWPGPLVVALCTTAAAAPVLPGQRSRLLLVGLDLYVMLLVFMGGRLIAGAAAGQHYRQGDNLVHRVQPRLEAAALLALLALTAGDLLSAPEAAQNAAAACAALLLLARWWRWRPLAYRRSYNLALLCVGYLWLPLGLAIRASRSLAIWTLPIDALHGLSAGALGSLTLLVMGRTQLMARGRDPERSLALLVAGLLVSAAAGVRLAAGVSALALRPVLLAAAAACWSGGFALLVAVLMEIRPPLAARSENDNHFHQARSR